MKQLHVGPEALQNGYKVLSIKDSIINEGCHIGIPSTIITLAEGHEPEAKVMTIEQIISCINLVTVTITGAEPATQDLTVLAIMIKKHIADCHIRVETHGTLPIFDAIMDDKGVIQDYVIDWIIANPLRTNNYVINPACNVKELKYLCERDFSLEVIPEIYRTKTTIWLHPASLL